MAADRWPEARALSAPDALVYCELEGDTHLVGSLWLSGRAGTTAAFRYADSWLEHPHRFAIDPLLTLDGGVFYKDRPFCAISDSAPDQWGRTLMVRAEHLRAADEGRARRALRPIDYVLGVSDLTRHGALRYAREADGAFLAPSDEASVPPLVELPTLMAAVQGFLDDPGDEDALRILLAPGSSLGGARPKASVVAEDGRLSIAKFGKRDDPYSVNAWEQLALDLARDSGIRTAESELHPVVGYADVILLPRFDREGAARTPFLSAMTMVDAQDGQKRSYLELAEAIQRYGASTRADLRELWRRIAFNVLISNTDDHLRNHGFLYAGEGGWTLSPAYDLNPQIGPRLLATAIAEDPEDTSASLSLAFEVAGYFAMEEEEARTIAREVGEVTSTWAGRAEAQGIRGHEVDLMVSAFEHEDLELALGR